MKFTEMIKVYQDFSRKYGKLRLPKEIRKPINLFMIIFLAIGFIPITLILLNIFKVVSVYRISFLIWLIGGILVLLMFYSYTEIAGIKYLRMLITENNDEFLSELELANEETDQCELIKLINELNLRQYFFFIWLKNAIIWIIGVVIFYFILRKFF